MDNYSDNRMRKIAMYRRWAYIAIALFATWMLSVAPPFVFKGDEGIIYDRSYSMNIHEVVRTQVIQEHAKDEVTPYRTTVVVGSVKGLYYMYKIMWWSIIACFLIFYPTKVRWYMSLIVVLEAAAFYVLYFHYILNVSDSDVTLGPSWMVIFPAVVIVSMVLLNRNIARYGNYFDDIIDDN